MTHVVLEFRQTVRPRRKATPRGLFSSYFSAFGRLISDWRAQSRKARADAQLARTLAGYDEHILRDIGLTWVGGRVDRRCCDQARCS